MVGRELLPNAVSLNSVLMNSARIIGPTVGAGIIFALSSLHVAPSGGYAACFFVNAATFAAVIAALSMMRSAELHRTPPVVRARGQVREGLRYVWSTPALRDPLLVMSVVGVFAFNFTTTLPLLAEYTFHGGAGTYSLFTAAMGSGAIVGGLVVAHRSRPSRALLSLIGFAFGMLIIVVAWAPVEQVAVIALVFMGVSSIAFIATANATLQLTATPAMRGRVMALFAIAFLGSTPIGGPLVGWISDVSSPRIALLVGGVATLTASVPLAVRSIGRPVVPQVRALFGPPQGGGGPKVAVAASPLPAGLPSGEGDAIGEQASA
jgi:MFS family permease